jgi:CheY-like chemotaxis protein
MPRFNVVMLVDDDAITRMVCERIIKMTEFSEKSISAENGKFAIDYFKQKAEKNEDNDVEIIFLDINMPVMNGWDFLDEFEKIKNSFTMLPKIYILSSTVDPEDYKKATSYSTVTNLISKPLSKEVFDEI